MFSNSPAADRPKPNIAARGLPMTPHVALRSLYEQLSAFEAFAAKGTPVNVFVHFRGVIKPPTRHASRPMGDAVLDSIADYASRIVARAGLLTMQAGQSERDRLEQHSRATRMIFATEHALAIDLARTAPHISLREREVSARAVLALAAFWCHQPELFLGPSPHSHPLLGERPRDAASGVLYDHASQSLKRPESRRGGRGMSMGIEIGINPTE